MPLTQPTYLIALDDLANEHEVAIVPADQLRAETEGNRRGLIEPKRQGQLLTFLWLWAAARRLDLVDRELKFEAFVDRLVAWEPVRQVDHETGEQTDAEVPPTFEAGSSTSASSSQADSPASTGSEPSSTTPPSSPQPSDFWNPNPSEVVTP
jgi:hypothetical protein